MGRWLFLWLIACGDDPVQQVQIEGDRTLVWGDQKLLELADVPLIARTYNESVDAPLSIPVFTRTDEQQIELGPFIWDEQVLFSGPASLEVVSVSLEHTVLEIAVDGADSVALRTVCGEGYFGWGERYDTPNPINTTFDLIVSEQGIGRDGSDMAITGSHDTTYFPMPWFIDRSGVGVLIDTPHRVRADLCDSDAATAEFEVMGSAFSVHVFHGPTPADAVRQLGQVVGRPRALPDWAFTPWHAIQGGSNDVRTELAALLAADVPVGAVWSQDWTGQRRNFDGGSGVQYRWTADPELYPDLEGLVSELHAQQIRFLAYVNPFIDPNLPDHYPFMAENDLLLLNPQDTAYNFVAPNLAAAHPDFSKDATKRYVQGALAEAIDRYGFDGWMADFAEWTPFDAHDADGLTGDALRNLFPLQWHESVYEAVKEAGRQGDFVSFARSGWTGVHGVSQLHWVGDQEADWSPDDGLPTVVPAMLSLGLSGIPYVTLDIGGFSGGPSTQELFQRWAELGAFNPVFRTHEGNFKDLNWRWDKNAETTDHFRAMAKLHQQLAPLYRALADQAQESGLPIIRHLLLEFPNDDAAWGVHDQFMIGSDILVAPITTEGTTSREVYLPAGSWTHLWSGLALEGPTTMTIDAPIGQPAAFARRPWTELLDE